MTLYKLCIGFLKMYQLLNKKMHLFILGCILWKYVEKRL